MSNESEKSNFGTGFLVGAIVGVIAGILFTPQSGEKTRDQLKEKALDLREHTEEIIDRAKEIAGEAITEGKDAAARAKAEFQEKVEHTRSQTE